jgi:hypothetical protein
MQENHEPVAKRLKTQEPPSFYAQVKNKKNVCFRIHFFLLNRNH